MLYSSLSFDFFLVAGNRCPDVPAIIPAIAEAVLSSLTCAGETFFSVVANVIVVVAVTALTDIEVFVCLAVNNFAALAHLLGGDVGGDGFDVYVCHDGWCPFKFVCFTDSIISL